MQALDYDMGDSPRLQQWNVNVQREVLSGTSVTLAYVGSHGDRLQRQRDTNPVTPRTLPDGTVVYGSRSGAQTISNRARQPAVRRADQRQQLRRRPTTTRSRRR